MKHLLTLFLLLAFVACTNQQDKDRIAKLEKQTKELQERLKKQDEVVSLDTQAKCSAAAKVFFNNWGQPDKETILLTYSNHYNRAMGKCFVQIEYHQSNSSKTGSWMNTVELYDVYENSLYGRLMENNIVNPQFETTQRVVICQINRSDCKKSEEFNKSAAPFMNN